MTGLITFLFTQKISRLDLFHRLQVLVHDFNGMLSRHNEIDLATINNTVIGRIAEPSTICRDECIIGHLAFLVIQVAYGATYLTTHISCTHNECAIAGRNKMQLRRILFIITRRKRNCAHDQDG